MAQALDPTLLLLLIDAGEDELALSLMEEELEDMNLKKAVTYFNLCDVPDSVCIQQFRFSKGDIYRLCHLLHIPDPLTCNTRIRVSASFGLCVVLRRLVYPDRFCDLSLFFGRSPSHLSLIFKTVSDHNYYAKFWSQAIVTESGMDRS